MLCDGATTVIKTYLRNVDVGLLGSHEVGLVAPMPLDQEVQFPGLLRGSEDLLRLQSSGKSSRLVVSPFRESVKKKMWKIPHMGLTPDAHRHLLSTKSKLEHKLLHPSHKTL